MQDILYGCISGGIFHPITRFSLLSRFLSRTNLLRSLFGLIKPSYKRKLYFLDHPVFFNPFSIRKPCQNFGIFVSVENPCLLERQKITEELEKAGGAQKVYKKFVRRECQTLAVSGGMGYNKYTSWKYGDIQKNMLEEFDYGC